MKNLFSAFLLLCVSGIAAIAQPTALAKPSGVEIATLDTALFKRTISTLMQDAEAGFAKTKSLETEINGQKIWGANVAVAGALTVYIRAVQSKLMYESVLHANPSDDEALGILLQLSGLAGRALGSGYINESGASLQSSGGSGWQERYDPTPSSGKKARLLLQKSTTKTGAYVITLYIRSEK